MFKVIIIIFFNLTIVFSQNINELFDNGNEFYSQNNYKEAISNYEKILENGYFSEDLYLNLGNAYFYESNFGKARWSYEMGLKLNPINSDLKNNNNVNKAYIDGYIELPKNNLIDIINILEVTTTSAIIRIGTANWDYIDDGGSQITVNGVILGDNENVSLDNSIRTYTNCISFNGVFTCNISSCNRIYKTCVILTISK